MTPLPVTSTRRVGGKVLHPLAESTPLRSEISAQKSFHQIPNVQQQQQTLPAAQETTALYPSNIADNAQHKLVSIRTPSTSVESSKDCHQDSTESQMEVLYQSLQVEAQKIQKFKVHALAQIKQKTDEIEIKESQIKKLSLDLSSARSSNSNLVTKMARQRHNNEDMMNKVATTRDMCFSLAEEHIRLKDLIDLGKEIFRETKRKSARHSQSVKKTLEHVDQYRAVTDERLSKIEQAAKTQNMEHDVILKECLKKEKSLLGQIDAKIAINNQLQVDIDNNLKEISLLNESLATQTAVSQSKEAELTAAMEELALSKNDEVSALQSSLTEALSASKISEEKWTNETESLKCDLLQSQTELKNVYAELNAELATNERIANEKASCEEMLAAKELSIANLTTIKSELENCLDESKNNLEEKVKVLEEIRTNLDQTKTHSADVKQKLEKEILEKTDTIELQITTVEKLETKVSDLEDLQHQLQTNCESLEATNTSLNEVLKASKEDQVAKNNLLNSKCEEIQNLKEMLEKTSLDATADQYFMKQSIEKLRVDYNEKQEVRMEKISDLQLELQNANLRIEELADKQRDTIAIKDEELSSLKALMKSQQHDFETTIKHKTDAFTKVQDEMQRMLDEATVNNQQKLSSLKENMNKLQLDHEVQIQQKTEAFAKAQDELQRMLNKSEKKLELENQKTEDLTQELAIVKESLDKSLQDKNTVALALAQKTQEFQDVSSKLLVKDCEFSKLMSAVQNLKSRWAAVATPMTPASTPPQITPQQAAVRPTGYSTPLLAGPSAVPSTPILKSTTPVKRCSGALTPQKPINNTTPRSAGSLRTPSYFTTPRTPNSAENPRGILRNEGSASKPNRVVFSTPIEQKTIAMMPSDSDTSILDIEVVNKSLQLKRTPESKCDKIARNSSGFSSSQQSRQSVTTPNKKASTPSSGGGKEQAVTSRNTSMNNSSVSPAMSSQGTGERLPRSKMLKANNRKRPKPMALAGKEDLGMLSKTMKKHRALMDRSRPMVSGMPVRESDSDCFGFGSE